MPTAYSFKFIYAIIGETMESLQNNPLSLDWEVSPFFIPLYPGFMHAH